MLHTILVQKQRKMCQPGQKKSNNNKTKTNNKENSLKFLKICNAYRSQPKQQDRERKRQGFIKTTAAFYIVTLNYINEEKKVSPPSPSPSSLRFFKEKVEIEHCFRERGEAVV